MNEREGRRKPLRKKKSLDKETLKRYTIKVSCGPVV